jgi:hypothetical protein
MKWAIYEDGTQKRSGNSKYEVENAKNEVRYEKYEVAMPYMKWGCQRSSRDTKNEVQIPNMKLGRQK